MEIHDKVFVVDWSKHYSDLTRWKNGIKKNIFPIKTELPSYCGINHHWEFIYEPNFTLKGTVNKREPKKLVSKNPIYKTYKWEIVEIFKHPKTGKLHYDLDQYTQEQLDHWKDYSKYTENNLFLLASTHTDKDWMKCYIVIEETGVSKLTPEQYADQKFNATIEGNYGRWNRKLLNSFEDKRQIPKEIKSVFYDKNDRVLFGSTMIKGLVSYEFLEGKFSIDQKPIYLGSSVLYDGKGNESCPNPELIKDFDYIKSYIEN